MEPRKDENKILEPGREEKKKRFRVVKLEERIAPGCYGRTLCVTCGRGCTLSCSPGQCK